MPRTFFGRDIMDMSKSVKMNGFRSNVERELLALYNRINESWFASQIQAEIKKILLDNNIGRCFHEHMIDYKCIDCGVEMPICPDCKERKWLFSDYNMCGDCWGRIMSGQNVVDG